MRDINISSLYDGVHITESKNSPTLEANRIKCCFHPCVLCENHSEFTSMPISLTLEFGDLGLRIFRIG